MCRVLVKSDKSLPTLHFKLLKQQAAVLQAQPSYRPYGTHPSSAPRQIRKEAMPGASALPWTYRQNHFGIRLPSRAWESGGGGNFARPLLLGNFIPLRGELLAMTAPLQTLQLTRLHKP